MPKSRRYYKYFVEQKNPRLKRGVFSVIGHINKRMCRINQRSYSDNLSSSIALTLVLAALGIIYMIFAGIMFHTLWYHTVFAVCSTFVFVYLCYEYYFELQEKKIKADLPKCSKKLAHYYAHYKGNVINALRDTEEKGPQSTSIIMAKIRKALESVNMRENIELLKAGIPYTWVKMLCSILMFGKDSGSMSVSNKAADYAGEEHRNAQSLAPNEMEKSLRRIANIFIQINIEQGYNDADLHGIEMFMFFSPYFFIIATEMFNSKILNELGLGDVYGSVEAQTLKALMFLIGNLSALFIHWMRKQQA